MSDSDSPMVSAPSCLPPNRMTALGYMSSPVLHDLKDHLQLILTAVEVQLLGPALPPDISETLRSIYTNVTRATTLLDTFSVISHQHYTPFQPISVPAFLDMLTPELQQTLGAEHTLRRTDLAPNATVMTDPHQLAHVLILLTLRARRALAHNAPGLLLLNTNVVFVEDHLPYAHLTVHPNRYYATIALTDTGTPIPLDAHHRYFCALDRLAEGPDPLLNLQMATVSTILQRLSAGITLIPRTTGGTSLTLYLPLASPATP